MPEIWLSLIAVAAALAAAWWYLRPHATEPVVFTDPREERLARQVAQVVGCSLAQALPAVRREIDLAPKQADATLVKRAAYHYQQELPGESCPSYQDPVRG
jgi:hypothetical protein